MPKNYKYSNKIKNRRCGDRLSVNINYFTKIILLPFAELQQQKCSPPLHFLLFILPLISIRLPLSLFSPLLPPLPFLLPFSLFILLLFTSFLLMCPSPLSMPLPLPTKLRSFYIHIHSNFPTRKHM